MIYSKIVATGSYLPEKRITNEDLSEVLDTSDEWIVKRVGIRERRIVDRDSTNTMAVKASKAAIEMRGIDPNEIGLIIVGTATSDYFFPSTACLLQDALNIRNQCPAFDLNAACAGFMYGLSVANQYIKAGAVKTALIVGVESLSRVVDWTDRSTCVLFGDGAGAILLEASEEPGIIHSHILSDGQFGSLLCAKSMLWSEDSKKRTTLHMDGPSVFKIAVSKLESIVDDTLEQAGLKKSQIDWLIPHQANMRIIKAAAKRLNLPLSRVILTIEKHGNTSAASIPLALDSAVRSGRVKSGEMLMLEAFGAGFAWGSVLVRF